MPGTLPLFPVAPEDWERLLAAKLDAPVEVHYGRARASVVRARYDPARACWVVRLNAMFADAPVEVQESLAIWLRSGRRASRACSTLDGWIEARLARLCSEQPRQVTAVTRGRQHDLTTLAAGLIAEEFRAEFSPPAQAPAITWGRAARSRSRRSLRLGSYDYAARLIRMHRVLDRESVPAWFVRYVLFHELLHAVLDEPRRSGRRTLHGPEFRRRERAYRDFERARAWEQRHIDALIRAARRGSP